MTITLSPLSLTLPIFRIYSMEHVDEHRKSTTEAESEVISVDIEEQAPQAGVSEEVVADSDDSTIVRNDSDDSNELESYSENVQSIDRNAKRKQAMEEAEAAAVMLSR